MYMGRSLLISSWVAVTAQRMEICDGRQLGANGRDLKVALMMQISDVQSHSMSISRQMCIMEFICSE